MTRLIVNFIKKCLKLHTKKLIIKNSYVLIVSFSRCHKISNNFLQTHIFHLYFVFYSAILHITLQQNSLLLLLNNTIFNIRKIERYQNNNAIIKNSYLIILFPKDHKTKFSFIFSTFMPTLFKFYFVFLHTILYIASQRYSLDALSNNTKPTNHNIKLIILHIIKKQFDSFLCKIHKINIYLYIYCFYMPTIFKYILNICSTIMYIALQLHYLLLNAVFQLLTTIMNVTSVVLHYILYGFQLY